MDPELVGKWLSENQPESLGPHVDSLAGTRAAGMAAIYKHCAALSIDGEIGTHKRSCQHPQQLPIMIPRVSLNQSD